jgi:hypothetical protein
VWGGEGVGVTCYFQWWTGGRHLLTLPCFPRFRWIFAAKAWSRLEVKVSRPQIHGHFSKLLVCFVWGVKPIYHDSPVVELQHCVCFVEQHHIFNSHYQGGIEGGRGEVKNVSHKGHAALFMVK